MTSLMLILIICSVISFTMANSYVEDYLASHQLPDLSDVERQQLKESLTKLYNKENRLFEKSTKVFETTQRRSRFDSETIIFDTLPHSETFGRDNSVTLKRKSTFKRVQVLSEISRNNFLVKVNEELFSLTGDGLSPLTILNMWTKSPKGCKCSTVFSKPMGCACCEPGGCVCSSQVNTCMKCGQEFEDKLCSNHLNIRNVTTFDYKTAKWEPKKVFVIAGEKKIQFVDYDEKVKTLKELRDGDEPIVLDLPNHIEGIKYHELLTYDFGLVHKRRLLFVFSTLGASNACFEITDVKKGSFVVSKLFEWSRKGSAFDVVNVDGRILIGFISERTLTFEHMKINGNNVVMSEFRRFNKMKADAWNFFKIGRQNIFLVQENDFVKIFSYSKGKYTPIQDIAVTGLQKVISIPIFTSGTEGLLIFIFSDRIEFYSQDNSSSNKFLLISIEKFEEKYWLQTTSPIVIERHSYLLIDSNSGSELFQLDVFISNEENYHQNDVMDKKFREIKSEYEDQIKLLTMIHEDAFANSFNKAVEEKLAEEASEEIVTGLRISLTKLDKNIQDIKRSVQKLKIALKDVVPKSGTKKIITGDKHFYGPKTAIDQLVVTKASVGDLFTDEAPLAKIIQNLVQITDKQPIDGRKIFGRKIKVTNLHTSTLNGKDMENFVTSNKPAEIDGATYLKGVSVKNNIIMHPDSEVYGRDLSNDVITKMESIGQLGKCHFEDLKALGGIKVETDIVNSMFFLELTRSFLKSEGNISLYGSVAFSDLNIHGNLDARSVMEVNKTILLSDVVTKSENQTLSNVKFLNSVYVEDLVANRINGEVFPDEFVTNHGSWINFGSKSFNKIYFKELSVGGYIDYVKTADLVTKSSPQSVLGLKTFEKGIKVLGNLNILASRIDGVDLSVLATNVNQTVDKKVFIFEDEVTVPGLIVHGKVNNLILEDVAKDLVFKDENETVITGRKVFLQDLIINKSITSDSINKIDFSTFVNTEKKSKIVATKSFSSVANFDNIKVNGLIDNTNLTELVEGSVLLDKPYQIVTGDKHFKSIFVNHLNIKDHLNHHPLNNILTKTTDQIFLGNVVMEKATFEHITAKDVNVHLNGTLNGISISDIKKELQRVGTLDSELIVEGDVYIKKELIADTLNQHKVNKLYSILLKNEKHQVLISDVYFKELEIEGMVSTADRATGNATLLKKNAASALRIFEKNLISRNMWWESMEMTEINARGLINGIKLHKLHEDLIYINDPNTYSVKGVKHFLNGFNVTGDLETNSVNGKDLRKDLFSKTTRQVIRSPAKFGHIIGQNVFLQTFNGVDVNKFKFATKREKTLIVAPLTFHGYVHVSNLRLTGKVGDEDLSKILDDAVDLRRKKVVVSGKKTFIQTPTFSKLNVVTLNSKPLLKTNESKSAINFLVVNGTVSALTLSANNLKTKNRNSLLSPSYLRNNYLLAKDLFESLKFEDLVINGNVVTNKINGENLQEQYLTRNTKQLIWLPMNISSMFTNDVNVYGGINGYEIPKGSLPKEETKVIGGSIVYNKTLNIPADLFVNGKFGKEQIDIPQDLIFLNKKNVYNGFVSFSAPLVTTNIESTDHTLNGFDLSALDAHLRSYRKTFQHNVVFKSNESNSFVGAMESIYNKECEKTSRLQSALSKALVQPNYFEIVDLQEFGFEKSRSFDSQFSNTPILIYKSASNHWMMNSLHFGSCETKVLKWNKSQSRFIEVFSLGNLGNVRQWIKLDGPSYDTAYLLAVSSDNGPCGLNGSSLWRANHSTLKFEKIQELAAASRAFVLPSSTMLVYFDIGYKLTLWSFDKDVLEKRALADENRTPVLKLLKWFDKPGGGKITVQYYNDMLDIVDDNRRRILFMPNIIDLFITTHLNDVIFIISKKQNGLGGIQFFVEVHLYLNLKLVMITSENLGESHLLLPLDIPDDDSDAEMVFALTATSPRVYSLGGEPFLKIWSEFPVELSENLWWFQFIDSENNFFLGFGDETKVVTLRLKKEGKKYHENILICN